MASTITRRVAESHSYVVLSSSTSGQLTLPLVDPCTGKTEHYALVKVDTPPMLAGLGLSPRLHTRLSRYALSEQPSRPDSQTALRLDRLAKECMLDISGNALRMLEQDRAWPCLALSNPFSSSSALACSSLPPASRAAASISSIVNPFDDHNATCAETPSLFNESHSAASIAYVDTPVSRARRQNTVTALGSAGNNSALVGLGIMGMMKEDGSPFDGLGSLPRPTHVYADSPEPSASGSEPGWTFFPELSAAAFANDAPEDPYASFWKTSTAADFRRYLDHNVSANRHRAPIGAEGSWKMSRKAGATRARSSSFVKGHKKRFSMPRVEEDLFMCQSPVTSTRADRIMGHLEGTKVEAEFWADAGRALGVPNANRRPVSCVL